VNGNAHHMLYTGMHSHVCLYACESCPNERTPRPSITHGWSQAH